MHTTKYLIVGAGMTGDMAAKGIREHDSDGSITMIGADPNPPYKRPLLTKGLWKGSPEEKLWREPAEGVELVTGRRIVSLDLAAHTATSDEGEEYRWEKLLLATGAKPREIPGAAGVIWYRTLDDYHRLREIAPEGSHVVVIGGGFIGSEIAAGLVGNGIRVTMLFPEPGIGFRLFPLGLSQFVAEYYREKGVDVRTEELVKSASGNRVETESGLTLEADAVVAGLGVIAVRASALERLRSSSAHWDISAYVGDAQQKDSFNRGSYDQPFGPPPFVRVAPLAPPPPKPHPLREAGRGSLHRWPRPDRPPSGCSSNSSRSMRRQQGSSSDGAVRERERQRRRRDFPAGKAWD